MIVILGSEQWLQRHKADKADQCNFNEAMTMPLGCAKYLGNVETEASAVYTISFSVGNKATEMVRVGIPPQITGC